MSSNYPSTKFAKVKNFIGKVFLFLPLPLTVFFLSVGYYGRYGVKNALAQDLPNSKNLNDGATSETTKTKKQSEETTNDDVVETGNEDNLVKNQPKDRFVDRVKLQILDKITGKISSVDVPLGTTVNFERLEIVPLLCWKSYPEERPENKLLLKVFENRAKFKRRKKLFYGWIFSSSPGIVGLEHPLYDITLKECYSQSVDNSQSQN